MTTEISRLFTPYAIKLTAFLNPLRANPTKWPNTLKKFVGKSRQIV